MPISRAGCLEPDALSHEDRRPAAERLSGVELSGTRGHILVVDDDHAARDAVSGVLTVGGYTVTRAHSRADALIKLSQLSLPVLILLDLATSQLGGQDFLREVLQDPTYSRIPVVVVSATSNGREVAAALGAEDCLRKPIAPGELLRAVERALNDWDDEAAAPTERQPLRED
jgi:CheY-like chemotaxis protein